MDFSHRPVLLTEAVDGLAIKPDGLYVDCTLGGGGHSFEIASRLMTGLLIGIDRDASAIQAASARLSRFSEAGTFRAVHAPFDELGSILSEAGRGGADGILFDLGVSSHQLDERERGFSYHADAPLDMRMDVRQSLTAADVVNQYDEKKLADLFFLYGEERYAKRIAAAIAKARSQAPITRTEALAELIKYAVPPEARRDKHPAKRCFQALRIEVNGELDRLTAALGQAVEALAPEGRLAVITFHSLEDRIVKQFIADKARGCVCPPEFPVCVCGFKPILKQITRKPTLPSEEELAGNPRSHSAKLRVAEKCLPDGER